MNEARREPSRAVAAAPRILVVEDESDLALLLTYNLEAEGYVAEAVERGDEAELRLVESPPDLVILDWMLPGVSGLEICRRLRARETTKTLPVIMLTARGEEVERVRGLSVGADDYVVKPFAPRELIFRVKAVLNRTMPGSQPPKGVKIDAANQLIHIDGNKVEDLTPTEFRILSMLLSKSPNIVPKEEMVESVWKNITPSNFRSLEVYIQRLRKKLGDDVGRRIETVPTKGYRYSV